MLDISKIKEKSRLFLLKQSSFEQMQAGIDNHAAFEVKYINRINSKESKVYDYASNKEIICENIFLFHHLKDLDDFAHEEMKKHCKF